MKSLYLIPLLLLFFAAPSALSAQVEKLYTDPVVYNDYIVDAQLRISDALLSFNQVFEAETITREDAYRKHADLIAVAEASVADIEGLEAYESNTEFRDAALELYRFYVRIMKNEYKELMELMLKPELTTEDEDRLYEIMDAISATEAAFDERYAIAQEAFATKYNITLVETEE